MHHFDLAKIISETNTVKVQKYLVNLLLCKNKTHCYLPRFSLNKTSTAIVSRLGHNCAVDARCCCFFALCLFKGKSKYNKELNVWSFRKIFTQATRREPELSLPFSQYIYLSSSALHYRNLR